MTEHLSTAIIELYRRGELRGKQRLEADIHLAACRQCSQLAGEAETLQVVFNAIRSSLETSARLPVEHLSGEQIADYVNRKLDEVDLEIVSSHLVWCEECVKDVKDIEGFAAEVAAEKKKNASLLNDLWNRLKGLGKNSRPVFLPAAGALAVVAAASFGVWRLSQSEPDTNPAIATATPPQKTISPTPPTNFSPGSANAGSGETLRPTPEQLSDLAWALPGDRLKLNAALRNRALEIRPDIAQTRAQATYLGESKEQEFALQTPTGVAVREVRPLLKWQPLKGAVNYKIRLVDKTESKTFPDAFTENTEWRPVAELQRGHRYVWHAIAISKEGSETYGRWMNRTFGDFFVLTDEQLHQIESAEKHYRSSQQPLASIALAMNYAKAGLVDDAERELDSYLKANPNSVEAKEMLKMLRVGGRK